MNFTKKFFLNGQEYQSSSNFTLSDFINYFNYNSALLVLEHNNFICPKEKWDQVIVKENDKIEIVTIVGGG
jgi:sulfur carrier protein